MENDLKKISLREIIMNTSWKPSEINNAPRFYRKDEVDELLKQFERPVVPQFVVDWFERNELRLEAELYSTAVSTNLDILDPLPFEEWFLNNENKPHETLIKMKLFGYEVEKGKLYYVHFIKTHGFTYLNMNISNKNLFLGTLQETVTLKTKFTEAEIKAINPAYWNPAFLEEVNE